MIPKGNLHAHGARLATYITKGDDGEQAELIEMRGFAATDLREAFCDVQAISESQTQCEKPFFHAYVRLPLDENLTREQWLQTADRIEAALGFDGQPRGVALHFLEDNTTHMHVAWSRIDIDQMKAIDPGLYIRKMKQVCRELEGEFGLRELSSDRSPDRLTKEPKRPEFEEARRLRVPVEETREIVRDCYSRSDNGPSFQAALGEHGFAVARGDRRDFVVLDEEGGKHGLGKSICGETAEEIRARFGAEFKRCLPTIAELAERMRAQREAAPEASVSPPTRDAIKTEVTALWAASDTGQAFAASLTDHGYSLARGDRRDFVLIDPRGDIHALPRMIKGARTAAVRAKLLDIDLASLPTVADAKSVIAFVAACDHATTLGNVVSGGTEDAPDTINLPTPEQASDTFKEGVRRGGGGGRPPPARQAARAGNAIEAENRLRAEMGLPPLSSRPAKTGKLPGPVPLAIPESRQPVGKYPAEQGRQEQPKFAPEPVVPQVKVKLHLEIIDGNDLPHRAPQPASVEIAHTAQTPPEPPKEVAFVAKALEAAGQKPMLQEKNHLRFSVYGRETGGAERVREKLTSFFIREPERIGRAAMAWEDLEHPVIVLDLDLIATRIAAIADAAVRKSAEKVTLRLIVEAALLLTVTVIKIAVRAGQQLRQEPQKTKNRGSVLDGGQEF